MSDNKLDQSERETRNRLLNAAGEVFAEKGFKAATVREICQRAGANVAAINYHFGDKQKLYSEVLRFSNACSVDRDPFEGGTAPEEQLRLFIHSMVQRVFDKGQPAWQGKLMSREMVEPTRALDYLIRHEIGPRRDRLKQTLRRIIGRGASEKLLRHCVQSIVGQCAFYHHARPMIHRLYPEQKFDDKGVSERAENIYHFSLSALRGISADRGKK